MKAAKLTGNCYVEGTQLAYERTVFSLVRDCIMKNSVVRLYGEAGDHGEFGEIYELECQAAMY